MTEDFRNKLINKALEMFSARGYDAVSIQEIVEGAGVTKPTLYHYFGSKRGLLKAIFNERLAGLREAVHAAVQYEGDLVINLRRLAAAYFSFAETHPDVYRLMLSAQYAPGQSESFRAAAEQHARLLDQVAGLFENALPHMHGRQRGYALTFIGMTNTYITLALNGHAVLDEGLMISVVHQFMHGIYS